MSEKEVNDVELFKSLLEKKSYTRLRGLASEMNVQDVAVILETIEDEDMLKMFRLFPKELAADVFAELEPDRNNQFL